MGDPGWWECCTGDSEGEGSWATSVAPSGNPSFLEKEDAEEGVAASLHPSFA